MRNVENINKVIDAIRADTGKHFRMLDFVEHTPDAPLEDGEERRRPVRFIECKTAFCIAGQANLIRLEELGENPKNMTGSDFREQFGAEHTAGQWLGLDSSEYTDLFHMRFPSDEGNYWVAQNRRESFDNLPEEARRRAGLRVLEILRDEDDVDWKRALNEAGVGNIG